MISKPWNKLNILSPVLFVPCSEFIPLLVLRAFPVASVFPLATSTHMVKDDNNFLFEPVGPLAIIARLPHSHWSLMGTMGMTLQAAIPVPPFL